MSKRKVIGYVVRTGMKPKKGQYVTFIDGVWDIGPKNASYVFGNLTHASNMAKSSVGRVVRIVAKERPLLPISKEADPIAALGLSPKVEAALMDIAKDVDDARMAVIEKARAEERERCARECEAEAEAWAECGYGNGEAGAARCADRIRALGEGVSPEVARVLFPDDDTKETELAEAKETADKYYVKARVYGAIACKFREALEHHARLGDAVAKEALAWRHSERGGVPMSAVKATGDLLNADRRLEGLEAEIRRAHGQVCSDEHETYGNLACLMAKAKP